MKHTVLVATSVRPAFASTISQVTTWNTHSVQCAKKRQGKRRNATRVSHDDAPALYEQLSAILDAREVEAEKVLNLRIW